jgi:hypothetical protein
MRRIERDMVVLEPPDDAELDRTYATLKQLHARRVRLVPAGRGRAGAARRHPDAPVCPSWINEWDLVQLNPAFRPETVAAEIASDYREDTALASLTAGDEPRGPDQE